MFDLNKEITEWKLSLHKNPSLEDGYIEELESHLRDRIESLTSNGLSEEKAFEKAKDEIGEAENIAAEFFKTDTTNKVSGRPTWKASRFAPILILNYFKVGFQEFKKAERIFIN